MRLDCTKGNAEIIGETDSPITLADNGLPMTYGDLDTIVIPFGDFKEGYEHNVAHRKGRTSSYAKLLLDHLTGRQKGKIRILDGPEGSHSRLGHWFRLKHFVRDTNGRYPLRTAIKEEFQREFPDADMDSEEVQEIIDEDVENSQRDWWNHHRLDEVEFGESTVEIEWEFEEEAH